MLVGVVNARLEGTIPLSVRNASGQAQGITAIVDTGLTGSLTLPPAVIASLGLPWRMRGNVILANGSQDQFDIYAGTVLWDGAPCHSPLDSDKMYPSTAIRFSSSRISNMALIACEVRPGLASFARFAVIRDLNGRQESLQVNVDFLTFDNGQGYLPVGVVYRDQERALIELPHEADSGTHRLWISPSDLR